MKSLTCAISLPVITFASSSDEHLSLLCVNSYFGFADSNSDNECRQLQSGTGSISEKEKKKKTH